MGLTLSCFLSSRYTSHCSMRWSIVRIVLHRGGSQSGCFPLVSTYFCVIFVYLTIILQLGHVFLEWVVLYSCTSHFLWLAVVTLLRFSTRCSNGVWFFARWTSRKSSGRLVLWIGDCWICCFLSSFVRSLVSLQFLCDPYYCNWVMIFYWFDVGVLAFVDCCIICPLV